MSHSLQTKLLGTPRVLIFYALLLAFAVSALFPFYYMFVTSFKTNNDFYGNTFGLPATWSIQNLRQLVLEHDFIRYLFNSLVVTAISLAMTVIVSYLASYAYSKMRFKGRTLFLSISIALTGIPPIIVLIPLYVFMAKMRMLNSYATVAIIYAAFMLPFSIYVITSFLRTIPDDLLLSAQIDGCRWLQLLYKIILPLSKPALITVVIMNGLWVWNELLISLLFLREESRRTITVALAQIAGRYSMNPTLVQAGALLVAVPMIVIYLLTQKYFMEGFASGAFKE